MCDVTRSSSAYTIGMELGKHNCGGCDDGTRFCVTYACPPDVCWDGMGGSGQSRAPGNRLVIIRSALVVRAIKHHLDGRHQDKVCKMHVCR